MSYIVGYLCMDRMVDEMPGADYVRTFMWLGVYVMVFFSFFIIRFANSFIIKRPPPGTGPLQHPGPPKRATSRC